MKNTIEQLKQEMIVRFEDFTETLENEVCPDDFKVAFINENFREYSLVSPGTKFSFEIENYNITTKYIYQEIINKLSNSQYLIMLIDNLKDEEILLFNNNIYDIIHREDKLLINIQDYNTRIVSFVILQKRIKTNALINLERKEA